MNKQEIIDKIDKKMQENGWIFLGPILHYKSAWKNQASIYKKDKKYVVAGIDSTGKKEIKNPISKKQAEKKIKESLEEIKKHMFSEIL